MGVFVQQGRVEVKERPEGYRELRCTPTHWLYAAPFSREILYTEAVSGGIDADNDADFWSASDAALRVRAVPAADLDIREMVVLATRRSTDYNAPKPWASTPWVNGIEAAWSESATHLHPFAKLDDSEKTDLWHHGGMTEVPLSRGLTYPLQTGMGIRASQRPPRIHEPWHGGDGVWYAWSSLEQAESWRRRQEVQAQSRVPQEGCLLLFVSHRWESPTHPDPRGRQLEAVRAGLTMALAAAILGTPKGSTASGLPELFARWMRAQGIDTQPLQSWAETVRGAAQATLVEAEILAKAASEDDLLRTIRERVLLWYDYASMFQSPRTAEEDLVFTEDLRRLNDIQAGAATLVLAENRDYAQRAWCFLEICGGVRGMMVEITPSWGKDIGAYDGIQHWGNIGDQLIGALVTHGLEAIRGSGLKATDPADLRVVAELLSRLALFGLVESSGSDLIGGAIPLPRRNGGWVLDPVAAPPEILRDGPPVEFGRVPDARTLELMRIATAEASGLAGKTGMWIYTSQRVLSLAWAARAMEWLRLAGIDEPLQGVACTWADSRALADDGKGWTRHVPSAVETLVIVTQVDLTEICLLLERVQQTHIAAGATVITVLPDTGRVEVQRPPAAMAPARLVEGDVMVVPRIRRYTAYPRYMLRRPGCGLPELEAMAALRLDPAEPLVGAMASEEIWTAGNRRVELEVKARLTTASWETYAKPRFTAEAWADPQAVLKQMDVLEFLVDTVCEASSNPFERRAIIYGILEKLDLMGDEPLTDDIVAFISSLDET